MTTLLAQPNRTSAVRWRRDTGFEMRCERCAEKNNGIRFWPMTLEFWKPSRGMTMCRACYAEYDRQVARENHANDRDRRNAQHRRYYRENKDWILPKRRAYHEDHREQRRAYQKAYYLANRERLLEQERARKAARRALAKAA